MAELLVHQLAFPRSQPRLGLLAGMRRVLFGDRAKRAHVSDHGAFMRSLGRAWAIPMTLVFSTGALIALGQTQIGLLVSQVQRGEPLITSHFPLGDHLCDRRRDGSDTAQLGGGTARCAPARRRSQHRPIHQRGETARLVGVADRAPRS
jgi:hypothetical protein